MRKLLVKDVSEFRQCLIDAYEKIKPSGYNKKVFEKSYDDKLDKKKYVI